MQRREYEALSDLREAQKPIILVFNQIDRLAREGIRSRLDALGGFEIVGECNGGRAAIAAIRAQAPHIVFCIYSRGMLRQIYTRAYFADEAANAEDPILALVDDPAWRARA